MDQYDDATTLVVPSGMVHGLSPGNILVTLECKDVYTGVIYGSWWQGTVRVKQAGASTLLVDFPPHDVKKIVAVTAVAPVNLGHIRVSADMR
jgi:hypothetical protein